MPATVMGLNARLGKMRNANKDVLRAAMEWQTPRLIMREGGGWAPRTI
jgi:hypothetical protein